MAASWSFRESDLAHVPAVIRSLLDDARRLSDMREAMLRLARPDAAEVIAEELIRFSLDGRRLWFVGIGGAGLSGYAVLAQAWGAEVAGWDRVETPYLAYVRAAGIEVAVAPEPVEPPAGWEVVVSSAFAGRVDGRSRAELLAELVAARRSIVVAGAHGKTTTAAMIAFCLDRLGHDPAYLIGGEVQQLGGNAGAGSGWLVVEGDESDRTIAALRPEIAVVTNVDLDHHSTFASRAEVEELFTSWLEHVPHVVHGDELAPADVELAVPGEHNRRNAACALAALELAGVDVAAAARVLGEFRGVGRRFDLVGEAGGVAVVRRLRATTRRRWPRSSPPRGSAPARDVSSSPSSRTCTRAPGTSHASSLRRWSMPTRSA